MRRHLLQPRAVPALRGPLRGRLLLPPRQVLLASGDCPRPEPFAPSPWLPLVTAPPVPSLGLADLLAPQARCWTTSPTRAACPCSAAPAPTAAAPTPRGPPSAPPAAPGRPVALPRPGEGEVGSASPLTSPLCSRLPPAPALGGCGGARTSHAQAPAPSRAGPTSPPTTRNSMTCMGTAATSCPRCGPQPSSVPRRRPVVDTGAGPIPRGKPLDSHSRGRDEPPGGDRPPPPGPARGATHSALPALPSEMRGQQPHRAGRAAQVRPDGQRELPQGGDAEHGRRGHGEGPAGRQSRWRRGSQERTGTGVAGGNRPVAPGGRPPGCPGATSRPTLRPAHLPARPSGFRPTAACS